MPSPSIEVIKVCGCCSARYDHSSWSALEPCGEVHGEAVRAAVVGWPENAVIDLRRCGKCAMVLARRR